MRHLRNTKGLLNTNNGTDYHSQENICHTSMAMGTLSIITPSLLGQHSRKF